MTESQPRGLPEIDQTQIEQTQKFEIKFTVSECVGGWVGGWVGWEGGRVGECVYTRA